MLRYSTCQIFMMVFIAFMTLFALQPAMANPQAIEALKQANRGNWAQAWATIGQSNDPAARDVLNWYAYTQGAPNISFAEISNFVSSHSNWPMLDKIRVEAERNINDSESDSSIINWFSKNQPITARGMERYTDALLSKGQISTAKKVLNNWWPKASLTRDQQRNFFAKYNQYLERQSHIERLDDLLRSSEYSNAMAMADTLGGGYPALAAARRGLAQSAGDVNALVNAVPAALKNNEGLLYERLKWRRKNNMDAGAIEILNISPPVSQMHSPGEWWKERHIIVRRLMERKEFKKAYALAAAHKQKEGFPLAEAEWISGFLALRFVNEPWKAFEHFERLYKNVESPLSKSRGAYWAGRASDDLKHSEIAVQWYQVAAKYPETFYGQLATERMGRQAVIPASNNAMSGSKEQFRQKDLAKAAIWLERAGLRSDSAAFLLRLSKNAQNTNDYAQAASLADELGERDIAIKIAQELQKEKGVSLKQYLYPQMVSELKNIQDVEWAFINAIIRQESRFDSGAVSHAGARGLMQLMPATAKETARKMGVSHDTAWLTSRPAHNVALGSRYLKNVTERFNGNYAMAAAAYNAGPSRVDKWIDELGDPRRGEVDLIDWVEQIPIYETRNYVQRVLEAVYVYRQTLKGKQKSPSIEIHVATN